MRFHQDIQFGVQLAVALALACFATPRAALAHADLMIQIDELTKQMEKDPKNAELCLQRGELYRTHQDWDLAAADYDKAQALNPTLAAIELARGRLYLDSGWPLSARACLDRYLSRVPQDSSAHVSRAHALSQLQLYLSAAADFTRAIGLAAEPGPELFIERAQALGNAGAEYRAEALRGLEEGVKRLGPLVTLQLFAIDLDLKQKNFDGALARVQQIADRSPRKESWLMRRGEILLQAGRNDEARVAFKSAQAAIETLPPTRRNVPAVLELKRRIHTQLDKLGPSDGPAAAPSR